MPRRKKRKGVRQHYIKQYTRREPDHDYLKYWRVIRYWAKRKYGLSIPEMDLLFFLYDEGLFSKADFSEYEELMSWDKRRFEKMRKDGWIKKWRNQVGGQGALYEISFKGKYAIKTIYNKLNGDHISENTNMFNSNVSYNDKVYRNYIKKINQSRKKPNQGRPPLPLPD